MKAQPNSFSFEQRVLISKESNTNDQIMQKPKKRIASRTRVVTRLDVLLRLNDRENKENNSKEKKNKSNKRISRSEDKKNYSKLTNEDTVKYEEDYVTMVEIDQRMEEEEREITEDITKNLSDL